MRSRAEVAKWAPVAALLLVGGLVAGGVLDSRQALAAGAAVELLLLVITGVVVARAIRRKRRGDADSAQAGGALEGALAAVLPRPIARIVGLEPLILACLWRWVRGRKPAGPHVFPYARRSPLGALVIVVLLTLPVEILLIELLLPWAWLRWLLLIGALYAALWLAGLYASLQVLPHQAEPRGLRLHYGLFNMALVPWQAIESAVADGSKPPRGDDGLRLNAARGQAWLVAGGRTDVRLELRAPVTIERVRGATPPIRTLHIAADDPEALVRAIAQHPEQSGVAVASLARVAG